MINSRIRRVICVAAALLMHQASNAETVTCNTTCKQGQNLWQSRSFGSYSSRDLLLVKDMYVEQHDRDEWNGTISTAIEYMQNFGGKCNSCKNLGALPFWSGTNTMTYGTNDGLSDIDVYQFEMGDVTGQGSFTVAPKVMHIGGDIMLHFTRNMHARGFYFKLRAPIEAMSISAVTSEIVADRDIAADQATNAAWLSYPSLANMYATLTEAWQGGSATADNIVGSTVNRPISLQKGRFSPGRLTSIRLGELITVLGYNVYGSDKGFVGIGAKFSCPTGNVPTGKYVFEPIAGKAGHWGVGMELMGHYQVWEHEEKSRKIDFWFDGDLMHLCNGRTPSYRSFDLKLNGPGSKYMLIQYYFASNPTTSNPTGRVPSFVTNAVNETTLPVRSTFNVEGSISLMMDMQMDNYNFAIGGEFWGRSKENLSFNPRDLVNNNAANLNDFAVLGRQISDDASGYNPANPVSPTNYVALITLCEPLARINKSLDRVDVNTPIATPYTLPTYNTTLIKDARIAANRIPANFNDSLDIEGASAGQAMTARIFGQLGYGFKQCRYTPHISIIGAAEFVPNQSNAMTNLWSVGAQGSISF